MDSVIKILVVCLVCLAGYRLSAAELTGTVRSAASDSAEIVLASDLVPAVGDKVDIFFMIPGGDTEIAVGTALVTGIGPDSVQVKMEQATGVVTKDHLARIHSANPTKRTVAVSATPPAPAPVPAVQISPPDKPVGPPPVLPSTAADQEALAALAKYREGDHSGAIAGFSKAIEMNPSNSLYHYNRGLSHLARKDWEALIADANKALELGSAVPADVHCLRGTGWAGKGDFEKAAADHTEAIRLNPKHALAYNNRANDKINLRDFDGALADCNASIALDPTSALPFYNRGHAHYHQRNFQWAIANWQWAIKLQPSYRAELEPLITALSQQMGSK